MRKSKTIDIQLHEDFDGDLEGAIERAEQLAAKHAETFCHVNVSVSSHERDSKGKLPDRYVISSYCHGIESDYSTFGDDDPVPADDVVIATNDPAPVVVELRG